MASISTSKKNGTRRLMFQVGNGSSRCQIYLGRIPLKQAEAIRRRVEALIAAKRSNSAVDGETASWLSGIDSKLRDDLVKYGLAEPGLAQLDLTLKELVDQFYASQAVKPVTVAAYKQATGSLLAYMGEGMLVRRIDPQQMDGWHKSLHTAGLARATVTKRVNIAKALFGRAVNWGVVQSCPLRHIKRGSQVNPDKLHYVTSEVIDLVLPALPDDESRLVVLLARYGGLRCPTEAFALRWQDINFKGSVIKIRSSKLAGYGQKGVRDIPLDPLLREALLKVGPGAPEDRVALRVTSATTNMRKMLLTAVLRAGLTPWPRLFQNLRASCEMDWADWAGHHAAAAWIGHSLAISAKHYVRVRGDHFEKVTGRLVHNAIHDALTTQFTTQHVPAPTCHNPQQMLRGPVKGRVVHLGADPCGYMLETSMGDTGLEPVTSRV